MAEIYDYVNLIDFVNNTEMSLRDASQTKHGIDMNNQTQTLMNQQIDDKILPEQLEAFMEFTNIKTIRSRLANKKVISSEFINVESGWFRAQYITVDSGVDGIPNLVIYTIRNVDEDKRREENLIRISMTDEMTRLYNRRSYDEDLNNLRKEGLDPNFVLFSIDINGLKRANDTNGHAAGDELIKAAAICLSSVAGPNGKVYRTGGDEFMIITSIETPDTLKIAIKEKTKKWKGIYTQNLALSVGYASLKENPSASIDDLEHLADSQMYKDKEKFYKENGIDRRRR
jgi:diguanylate cyclase (GGDEF)-like protein